MITTYPADADLASERPRGSLVSGVDAAVSGSAVSWAAIFSGALAAAILSLLLFTLGIGLGLSSVSVWSGRGAEGESVGWAAVAWLAFTQLASAGVGGYLAGRLRTKWTGVHTDEVYFRDTAHGFLAWALATLMMVVVMGSVAGSAISGTAKAVGAAASATGQVVGGVASAAGGAAQTALTSAAGAALGGAGDQAGSSSTDLSYWVNSLMRNRGQGDQPQGDAKDDVQAAVSRAQASAADVSEVASIFMHSLQAGNMSSEDSLYVSQLVARHSNMSTSDAQKKVTDTFAQVQQQIAQAKQKLEQAAESAKEAAEKTRAATASAMLWAFIALLAGAFVGAFSATWGGRQRDL